jgi:hypothetical protein
MPLTRAEIRQRWPGASKKPNEATLWRWLQHVVAIGDVAQEGA